MALGKPFSPRKLIAIVITARRSTRHSVQFFQILHGILLNVSHGLYRNDFSGMVLKDVIIFHFIIQAEISDDTFIPIRKQCLSLPRTDGFIQLLHRLNTGYGRILFTIK